MRSAEQGQGTGPGAGQRRSGEMTRQAGCGRCVTSGRWAVLSRRPAGCRRSGTPALPRRPRTEISAVRPGRQERQKRIRPECVVCVAALSPRHPYGHTRPRVLSQVVTQQRRKITTSQPPAYPSRLAHLVSRPIGTTACGSQAPAITLAKGLEGLGNDGNGQRSAGRRGVRRRVTVRDIRWANRTVRVTTPVPTRVWAAVAAADPSTMPFHTPAWRECVSSGSGWRDARRLYELPGERQLVLMMARRPGRLVQASWPEGWGSGGVLAAGGVRPDEMALVCADLAKSGSLNTTVRPGFVAAPAWPSVSGGLSSVPRAVHVAHLGQSFEDFWSRSVSARTRSSNRAAWRSLEQAGVVITRGNSPELVREFYQVYLQWIEWRARQRKMPAALARWRARQVEPFQKFATVASRLGADCQIWVASWDRGLSARP